MYMDNINNNTSLPLSAPGGWNHYMDTTGGVLPVSAFSAFHLLRNYNYLIGPSPTDIPKTTPDCRLPSDLSLHSPKPQDCIKPLSLDVNLGKSFVSTLPPHNHSNLLATHGLFNYHGHHLPPTSPRTSLLSPDSYLSMKRHRGEKKPIPEEQKDEKYFERRRRNNQAAKKSRDARKIREDQVALKATILEHENAILKAQVLTLREEASSLRQMLLQKKTIELNS